MKSPYIISFLLMIFLFNGTSSADAAVRSIDKYVSAPRSIDKYVPGNNVSQNVGPNTPTHLIRVIRDGECVSGCNSSCYYNSCYYYPPPPPPPPPPHYYGGGYYHP